MIDLINKKIRIFPIYSNDNEIFPLHSIEAGYLINLFIYKIKLNSNNIRLTTIYPFKEYYENFDEIVLNSKEDYLLFFLENTFHGFDYGLGYIIKLCNYLKKNNFDKKIIIHSNKISYKIGKSLLNKFNFIELIVKTDIELFFLKHIFHNQPYDKIDNIIYKKEDGSISGIINNIINEDLNKYIFGAYYGGYIENYQDDSLFQRYLSKYVIKNKLFEKTKFGKTAHIQSGRGCKYNCIYCYRGIKYSNIRQISLKKINKDLKYLFDNGYKNIYFNDDCFLTTNENRIKDIILLINKYKFNYRIDIRYEMLKQSIITDIINSNITYIKMGLQTIHNKTNKIIGRNFNNKLFIQTFNILKNQGIKLGIDIILGLPGDTYEDFINTLHFSLKLNPNELKINTLYITPGTKLFENADKYKLEYDYKGPDSYLFGSPIILSSSTFSNDDYYKAKKYIDDISKKYTNIKIYNR